MRKIALFAVAVLNAPLAVGREHVLPFVFRSTSMSAALRHFNHLAILGCTLGMASVCQGQNAFSPGGVEYPIAGSLPGDQTFPNAVIRTNAGYLVWQDNATDGDGLGIRAQRLDGNLNKIGAPFRVNAIGTWDQERPQLAPLSNGGAVFVWQGGKQGFQKIYARFLPATGTNFATSDILVNTYTNNFQSHPCVTTLLDGSVVVIWASFGQDGYLQGIFGQRLSSTGAKVGGEFQVNQYPLNNQRTPSVAALAGGGFVAVWVSELQRGLSTVDIYARMFDNSGTAAGNEFPVNTVLTNICANPVVVGSPDGGFMVAWSQRDVVSGNTSSSQFSTTIVSNPSSNSWDVYGRVFSAAGVATTAPVRMNTLAYGDQYGPKISAFGKNYLATWLSLGRDGSMEGIYGQFLSGAAELAGVEFQVNIGNASRQIDQSVCSDGVNRFLVTWSSYATSGSFDLFARSYELIRVDIVPSAQGVKLTWNTRPGGTYQVQSSADYSNWVNFGAARVATGHSDSVDIASAPNMTVYRVVRIY